MFRQGDIGRNTCALWDRSNSGQRLAGGLSWCLSLLRSWSKNDVATVLSVWFSQSPQCPSDRPLSRTWWMIWLFCPASASRSPRPLCLLILPIRATATGWEPQELSRIFADRLLRRLHRYICFRQGGFPSSGGQCICRLMSWTDPWHVRSVQGRRQVWNSLRLRYGSIRRL